MSKPKVHLAVHDGEADDVRRSLCGMTFVERTDDAQAVTCKLCLRQIEQETALDVWAQLLERPNPAVAAEVQRILRPRQRKPLPTSLEVWQGRFCRCGACPSCEHYREIEQTPSDVWVKRHQVRVERWASPAHALAFLADAVRSTYRSPLGALSDLARRGVPLDTMRIEGDPRAEDLADIERAMRAIRDRLGVPPELDVEDRWALAFGRIIGELRRVEHRGKARIERVPVGAEVLADRFGVDERLVAVTARSAHRLLRIELAARGLCPMPQGNRLRVEVCRRQDELDGRRTAA